MEYSLWISTLPLPPSVNEYLIPVQGRLVKSQKHRKYDQEFSMWVIRNAQHIEKLRNIIKGLMSKPNFGLQVDMYFCFHHPRIYSELGEIQRLDRDNRIKPATDQLHKIIGIDDKYIFSGNAEKVTTNRKDEECLIIKISTMKPRTKQDICQIILSESSLTDSAKS